MYATRRVVNRRVAASLKQSSSKCILGASTKCRYFSQTSKQRLFHQTQPVLQQQQQQQQPIEQQQEEDVKPATFKPETLSEVKWMEFFDKDFDKIITSRLYEHYKSKNYQTALPAAPENMPRDENGNEKLYFFDELCQWLFALESPRRKEFMKWLVQAKQREALARKVHFAFVRTKLAAANVKVEVPKELKRETVFLERMVRGTDDKSDILAAFGRKRLAEAYNLSTSPEDARLINSVLSSDPLDEIPAFIDEFANLSFEDNHRRTNKQYSFINARTSSVKKASSFPSSWNELSYEMTGELPPQFDHGLNVSVSTDSEGYLDKAFRAEKGMYAGFPFKEDEFNKYNMFLDQVEDGTMTSERAEGLPSGGALGAEDEEDIALEYPEESYERHGAKGTLPEGYYGDKYDPYEIHLRNPKEGVIMSPSTLESVRKFLPGTFIDDPNGYEEFVLKRARTTVNKTRGRIESYNAYILVCSHSGFIGAGFGEAQNPPTALKNARKNAIMNLRSFPRSAFPLMRNEIRAKFMKSEVVMFPSSHRNPVARPLFKRILHMLGIEYVSVKCYGSSNIINVVPAFFKCLDQLKTLEKEALQRGMLPTHLHNRTEDMMERVRHNRGIYGWH